MSNELSNPKDFRSSVVSMSNSLLADWVGAERAKESAGRISVALAASAASAKNPKDYYECTAASVAKVIAIAALTEIMPSTGATALAYAIPRRPRKGEAPQLQYQLSHRGINALAKRAGMLMIAIPIGVDDEIEATDTGEVRVVSRDLDNVPVKESQLRGVQVIVKDIKSGVAIASGWVSKAMIDARRESSDAYNYALKNEFARDSDPWHKWYVEQAMKTAMHYAINRGWCVVDDTAAVHALRADQEADYIEGEFTAARTVAKRLAKSKDVVALLTEDGGEIIDASGLTEAEKAAILREEANG